MSFSGWPSDAIDFYEGLEADNSKTYWNENKAVYENAVLRPMVELLADLAPEFGAGRVFRPYRDVRFSADKVPYKTSIAASLELGGYIQLSVEGLGAGCGMWMMAPDQLERYRQAVVAESTGQALTDLLSVLRDAGIEAGGHDVLKTAPRGYPKDHPRSTCCATRVSSAGSNGRRGRGWARRGPRSASSSSCGRRGRSTAGSTPTSARRRSNSRAGARRPRGTPRLFGPRPLETERHDDRSR